MVTSNKSNPIIDAPDPQKIKNSGWMYRFLHDMWTRTGGITSSINSNFGKSDVTSDELNTLVGIKINTSVQNQINSKESISNLRTMAYQNSNAVSITGGSLSNTNISNSAIQNSSITIVAGLSASSAKLNGTLFVNMTPVATTGAVEEDLISYSIPANVLGIDLQFLEIHSFGTFGATANNKTIKSYFGSTNILTSGTGAINNGGWDVKTTIVRTSASAQKISSVIMFNEATILSKSEYVTSTEDLTTSLIIKCTGTGTSANDIIQEGMVIKWFSN